MPVLARRRYENGAPVEELKGQEVDDAVRPRPRGLSRAAQADPVGGLEGAMIGERSGAASENAAASTRMFSSLVI